MVYLRAKNLRQGIVVKPTFETWDKTFCINIFGLKIFTIMNQNLHKCYGPLSFNDSLLNVVLSCTVNTCSLYNYINGS